MSKVDEKKVGRIFKVLSKPTNIRILCALSGNNKCVTNLKLELDLKQANLSQHLNILRDLDVLDCTKNGNKSSYYIADKRYIKLLQETLKIFKEEFK